MYLVEYFECDVCDKKCSESVHTCSFRQHPKFASNTSGVCERRVQHLLQIKLTNFLSPLQSVEARFCVWRPCFIYPQIQVVYGKQFQH